MHYATELSAGHDATHHLGEFIYRGSAAGCFHPEPESEPSRAENRPIPADKPANTTSQAGKGPNSADEAAVEGSSAGKSPTLLADMGNRLDGMEQKHPRTGITHHLADTFTHLRVVAMDWTFLTTWLAISETAMIQPRVSIFLKRRTFLAQPVLPMMGMAVDFYHVRDNPLLIFYATLLHLSSCLILKNYSLDSTILTRRSRFSLELAASTPEGFVWSRGFPCRSQR